MKKNDELDELVDQIESLIQALSKVISIYDDMAPSDVAAALGSITSTLMLQSNDFAKPFLTLAMTACVSFQHNYHGTNIHFLKKEE